MRPRTWWWLAAFVALVPLHSAKAAELQYYVIEVEPRTEGSAHYHVTLAYRAPGEQKRDGFKYLGPHPPTNFVATTEAGKRSQASVRLEGSSREWRADFQLPEPDRAGLQTVVLDFDQEFDAEYVFGGRSLQVPWGHVFKIPVRSMIVVALGAEVEPASGFSCTGRGETLRCEKFGKAPFPVSVPLGDTQRWPLVPWVLSIVGAVALLVGFTVRRRNTLLILRGILPPLPEPAYPEAPLGYRAPPPIKTQEPPRPRLSSRDQTDLVLRLVLGLFVLGAGQIVLLVAGRFGSPAEFVMAAAAVVVGQLGGLFVTRDGFFWIIPLLSMLAQLSLVWPLVWVPTGIVGFAYLITKLPGGGSSGGSSSSSSCGGGGGSSCGGGGGGGGCGG